jgi:TRAP-type C4-dicarboxylate transport system permease small subunit
VSDELLARYVGAAPTDWSFALTGYALVRAGFLAAAWTLEHGGHVRVEILADRLPRRPRIALATLTDLVALAFCLVVVQRGFAYVRLSYVTESTSVSELRTPMWIPELAVPIGATLLALAFVARILVRLGLAEGEVRE